MKVCIPFILMLSTGFFAACHEPAAKTTVRMQANWIPWLAANGQYGFCDRKGILHIQPQYDDARPFYNGFAVVGKAGKYGVIDIRNKVVIPLAYQMSELWPANGVMLVFTKKEYNAWWQFWHWKMLPEWNLLGGNSGPFLVTTVPRAKWEVRVLPGKKHVFSDRRIDDKSAMGTSQYWKADWVPNRDIPDDLSISATDGLLLVNDAIYRKEPNGRLRRLSGHFVCPVNGGKIMIRKGAAYFRADKRGQKIGKDRFTAENGITLETENGETVFISKKSKFGVHYNTLSAPVFKNQKGEIFLAPNLRTPFPTLIRDYMSRTAPLSAKAILSGAVMVHPLPNTNDYMIASAVDSSKGWRCFILHSDGSWDTRLPPVNGMSQMFNDGRIVFDRGKRKGVWDIDAHFYAMPLSAIQPCSRNHFWYMGKDTATGKYGVFDAKNGRWQVPPKYSYLQDEIAPGIAIYTLIKTDTGGIKKEVYGLIHIRENREITPPLYDRIVSTRRDYGRVIQTVQGRKYTFYINPETGKEYRKK